MPSRPITKTARTEKRRERYTPPRRTTPTIDHPKLRAVAYNASAAACGWWCGIGPWALNGMTHYGTYDVARGVWVGVGLALFSLLAEWKTHAWRSRDRAVLVRAAGWAGRIPLATTLTALALYGPDATL
ncbi:hypothetical protein [Streptomyces sp. LN549]|uniref:hypothetical protein n=1 Tax=Streptomyces sp. LN549 TaxID=3112979 RepID=UPI003718997E